MLVQNTHLLEARLIAGREEARMTDELYRAAVESNDAVDLLAILVSAYGDEVASRIATQGHLEATRLRLSTIRGATEAWLVAEAEARLRKAAPSRDSQPARVDKNATSRGISQPFGRNVPLDAALKIGLNVRNAAT
jgi:hypothetical protein